MSELVRDWKAERKDLEEAFDIISDKLVAADAEIVRLRKKLHIQKEFVEAFIKVRRQDRKLITELADALDGQKRLRAGSMQNWRDHWDNVDALLQRAREAIKEGS